MVHCNRPLLQRIIDAQSSMGRMPFGEGAMKNHCAYCHGKFGLVRHHRAFKSFCSRECLDQYKAWLRAEVGKRKGWSDCLWAASLNVVPYVSGRSSA